MSYSRDRRRRHRARLAAAGGAALAALSMATLMSAGAAGAGSRPAPGVQVSWSQSSATAGPSSLSDATAVYDSDNKTVVVFGGQSADGSLSNDTWVWDGSDWTDYRGSQIAAPPARYLASMAFDPQLHQLILFGGRGNAGNLLGDTWAWNGVSWYEEPQPIAKPYPVAREAAAMSYDGAGHLILFGGTGETSGVGAGGVGGSTTSAANTTSYSAASQAGLASLGDTWLWTSDGWVQAEVPGPPARSAAAMARDSAGAVVVLFGGQSTPVGSSPIADLSDTWTWNGSHWARQTVRPSPPARSSAAMDDAPGIGGVLLFGGEGAGTDAWMWSSTGWTQARVLGSPGSLPGAAAAYDAAQNETIVVRGSGNPLVMTAGWITQVKVPPTTKGSSSQPRQGGSPAGTKPKSSTTPPPAPRSVATAPGQAAMAPLTASSHLVHRGSSVLLSGSGFLPGGAVLLTLHSAPLYLGTSYADSTGHFRATVTVPDSAPSGSHHFEATGPAPGGRTTELTAAVTVVGPSGLISGRGQTIAMLSVAVALPVAAWLAMIGTGWMRRRRAAAS